MTPATMPRLIAASVHILGPEHPVAKAFVVAAVAGGRGSLLEARAAFSHLDRAEQRAVLEAAGVRARNARASLRAVGKRLPW